MKNNLRFMLALFYCLLLLVSNAQTSAIDNKPSKTITFREIPKGPSVFGVFEGRPPCKAYAKQLKISPPADCIKLKSQLILFRDKINLQPTTYKLLVIGVGDTVKQGGNSYQRLLLEGSWTITKGLKSNPDVEVITLTIGNSKKYIYLMKADDNVLFLLDESREFLVGNEDFSHTLNRVELVAGNK